MQTVLQLLIQKKIKRIKCSLQPTNGRTDGQTDGWTGASGAM